MKIFALCVVALVAMIGMAVAAEFPYPISSSDENNVVFTYPCTKNFECRDAGELYCGEGEVTGYWCDVGVECEVTCKALKIHKVGEGWQYVDVRVTPADKRVGVPFDITIKDNRDGRPMAYEVEVYEGGYFKTAQMEGYTHWAGSGAGTVTVVKSFTETEYVPGELVLSDHTNRQGVLSYTPTKPGFYLVKTAKKYLSFQVGDASGAIFTCGNGVCETSLGEDKNLCKPDCDVAAPVCGDGVCAAGESGTCAADCPTGPVTPPVQPACVSEGGSIAVVPNAPGCCTGLSQISCAAPSADGTCPPGCLGAQICANCGNRACGPGENNCNCPQDCPAERPASGSGDMTWLLVVIAAVGALGLVAFLVKSGKIKIGGAAKPAVAGGIAATAAAQSEANKAEEEKKAAAKKAEEEKKAEEKRKAEEKKEEEKRKAEEKKADEKKAEEAKKAEEKKRADEKKAKEEKKAEKREEGPKQEANALKCKNCGAEISPGSTFCVSCGQRILH